MRHDACLLHGTIIFFHVPYLGFIFAHGDDPATVEAALRAAHAQLQFTIEPMWTLFY
ncbi:hypothetical protein QUF63_04580 [Anaerolineales bacterium HSG25]|nr:hypothetical protein [Anaerolineales bacterium HSG25]